MKMIIRTLFAAATALLATAPAADACTNFIVTRGASTDGYSICGISPGR